MHILHGLPLEYYFVYQCSKNMINSYYISFTVISGNIFDHDITVVIDGFWKIYPMDL